jgi:uncharacterized protein (UPF0248 family)
MFRSKRPRDVLNEIRWRFDLRGCRVYYIHRGAPGDTKIAEGSAIKSIDRAFLVLAGDAQDAYIPYHRIFRIEYNNRIIFDRPIRPLPKKKQSNVKVKYDVNQV